MVGGPDGREIAGMLISQGLPLPRGIRFTLAFRQTITIAAVSCRAKPSALHRIQDTMALRTARGAVQAEL
jgi:hypothetical protein